MPGQDFYSDAELHDRIEEEVKASDDGGASGKWTAKKAEIVEEEYKEQGGGYKDNVGQENKERDEGSGKHDEDVDMDSANDSVGDAEGDENEEEPEGEENGDSQENEQDATEEAGDKRKRQAKSQTKASKKQKASSGEAKQQSNGKSHGSKHDTTDEPAPKGSNTRLPEKGQRVSWKAMPGWIHGKVLEVVTSDKDMKGKHIKASKDEPRVAMEADSGKFCVHKPDNCYFEDK